MKKKSQPKYSRVLLKLSGEALGGEAGVSLVVVPGQFYATRNAPATIGTQRLYGSLDFEIYHAPFTDTDFIAPEIGSVQGTLSGNTTQFQVLVHDDVGAVQRVLVLYRQLPSTVWQKVDLAYNPQTQQASGSVLGPSDSVEYVVQAVDDSGNVALVLDHGQPFMSLPSYRIYLPLVRR